MWCKSIWMEGLTFPPLLQGHWLRQGILNRIKRYLTTYKNGKKSILEVDYVPYGYLHAQPFWPTHQNKYLKDGHSYPIGSKLRHSFYWTTAILAKLIKTTPLTFRRLQQLLTKFRKISECVFWRPTSQQRLTQIGKLVSIPQSLRIRMCIKPLGTRTT